MPEVGELTGLTEVSRTPPPGPAGGGAGRTIRRRGNLPGGRAVVGAFLVTVAAVGLFAAYLDANAGPRNRYVVATRDLPIGTQLTAADLTTVPVDLPAAQRGRAYDDPDVLVGATVIGSLVRDELIQFSDVAAVSPDQGEQVSFPVPAERAVGGRIRPGERVDVLATFASGTDAFTSAVVRDAQVLQVDEDEEAVLAGDATVVLTLGLTSPEESLRLVHAVSAGEITVVRTTGLDRPGGLPSEYRLPASRTPQTPAS
jgi:Flp pilus assembly protein CpaB